MGGKDVMDQEDCEFIRCEVSTWRGRYRLGRKKKSFLIYEDTFFDNEEPAPFQSNDGDGGTIFPAWLPRCGYRK